MSLSENAPRIDSAKLQPSSGRPHDPALWRNPQYSYTKKSELITSPGPGPGKYKRRTSIGYDNHDPTIWRSPRYTFAGKHESLKEDQVPRGQIYNLSGLSRYGRATSPLYQNSIKNSEMSPSRRNSVRSPDSPSRRSSMRSPESPSRRSSMKSTESPSRRNSIRPQDSPTRQNSIKFDSRRNSAKRE